MTISHCLQDKNQISNKQSKKVKMLTMPSKNLDYKSQSMSDKKKKNVEDKIDTELGDVEGRVASDCSGEKSQSVVKDSVEKEVLNIEDEEISLNKSASDVLRNTVTAVSNVSSVPLTPSVEKQDKSNNTCNDTHVKTAEKLSYAKVASNKEEILDKKLNFIPTVTNEDAFGSKVFGSAKWHRGLNFKQHFNRLVDSD
ncbi:hypothetical protein CTI12_AA473270 [Artemisia annua]|uniref:Uncharacterized protein n=1 Tax=Artemisia annua TaxID=35608 RepID=A0A2U1LN11_ARTAN|nr:hypothetical protein CTI12_AA473270 [Artemisia annua]